MGRVLRATAGGLVYHVLNRVSARMRVFDKPGGREAFEQILAEAVARTRMRLLAYCVMPDHWHLVLWPRKNGDLSAFVGWLTLTHTQRLHARRRSLARGPVYEGRFKSFLIEPDEHLWMVCRYVERNPIRAGLCKRADQWRWSSAWLRKFGDADVRKLLSRWPLAMPKNWASRIGRKESQRDLEALRQCVNRGQPLGNEAWVARMTKRFKLASTFRPRGRPRKKSERPAPDLLFLRGTAGQINDGMKK